MFISILVQQFNPLFPFETTNFRAIVENSRLLLDELYRKVVALQDHAEIKSFNDLLLHNNQTAKLKKCNLADSLALPAQPPKPPLPLRPAHVYSSGRPDFLAPSRPNESSLIYEIKFLWERCKLMKEQFESLVQSLEEKEVEQLRFFSMYDKNPLINQVMRLFTVYLGVDRSHLMNDYDFDQLKTLRFEIVEEKLLRRLDESLKSNKRLSVDALMKLSRPVGVLFSLIEIKIRLYPPPYPAPRPSRGSASSWRSPPSLRRSSRKSRRSRGRPTSSTNAVPPTSPLSRSPHWRRRRWSGGRSTGPPVR